MKMLIDPYFGVEDEGTYDTMQSPNLSIEQKSGKNTFRSPTVVHGSWFMVHGLTVHRSSTFVGVGVNTTAPRKQSTGHASSFVYDSYHSSIWTVTETDDYNIVTFRRYCTTVPFPIRPCRYSRCCRQIR